MDELKLVIAEDDYFTREGIRSIVAAEPDMRVVGLAEQGEAALELVASLEPDLLLLDLSMPPGIDGLEVIRQIRATNATLKIIALTKEPRQIWAVEKMGGNGFVPKTKFQMFVPTIRCVAQSGGNVFIREEETEQFKQLSARVAEARLTPAEQDVWRLIGYANEEIGLRLGNSQGRIKNLITSLYFKLDIPKSGRVPQRIHAEQLARLFGVLEEPPID